MALGATMYVFVVRLADADRGLYETLNVRLARHPSETAEFLLTRLLAYCLEYAEGLSFSKGLSEPDEPALYVRDLTGVLQQAIEVGTPEAARLHKLSKAVGKVSVYPHRDAQAWLARLAGERIHRAADIAVHLIDRELISALAAVLDRRMDFDLSIAERHLYLTLADRSLEGAVVTRALDQA